MEKVICHICGKESNKYGIKTHIWRVHGEGKEFDPNKGYKEGNRKAWNKNLTKEKDERIERISNSLIETIEMKRINGDDFPGCCSSKYRATEKYKNTVAKNGGYRKGSGIGKKGWYKGYWCDSSWELAFVIYNLDHGVKFKKNFKGFEYIYKDKVRKYVPDFIMEDGTYVEIKGYENEQARVKHETFKYTLKVLKAKELENILEYVQNKYGHNYIKLYE